MERDKTIHKKVKRHEEFEKINNLKGVDYFFGCWNDKIKDGEIMIACNTTFLYNAISKILADHPDVWELIADDIFKHMEMALKKVKEKETGIEKINDNTYIMGRKEKK